MVLNCLIFRSLLVELKEMGRLQIRNSFTDYCIVSRKYTASLLRDCTAMRSEKYHGYQISRAQAQYYKEKKKL